MLSAVAHLLPEDHPHHAECEEILNAALAWQEGTLSMNDLLRLGTIHGQDGYPSPRYSRFVALVTARRNDPRRQALQAALDVVVRAQAIVNRFGVFVQADLRESDDQVVRSGVRSGIKYGGTV